MEDFTLNSKNKQDARIALLKYYSSECVAHGAYLVAISIGFLSLTEVDSIPFTSELVRSIVTSLLLSLFIVLLVYTLGRAFFWSYLRTTILSVRPKEENAVKFEADKTIVTFVQRLHLACVDYVKEKHSWSATVYALKNSTLALAWFYIFVMFAIVSILLLYLL